MTTGNVLPSVELQSSSARVADICGNGMKCFLIVGHDKNTSIDKVFALKVRKADEYKLRPCSFIFKLSLKF